MTFIFLKFAVSDYYILYGVELVLWFSIFIGFAFCRWIYRPMRHLKVSDFLYIILLNTGFSFMGTTIGLMTGLSMSPVIGVVIPALLTLYGGILSYAFLFGKKESEKRNGVILAGALVSTSFFLMLGADYGAAQRNEFEDQLRAIEWNEKKSFEIFKRKIEESNGILEPFNQGEYENDRSSNKENNPLMEN